MGYVPPRALRDLKAEIVNLITPLSNHWLKTPAVPEDWSIANVIPDIF